MSVGIMLPYAPKKPGNYRLRNGGKVTIKRFGRTTWENEDGLLWYNDGQYYTRKTGFDIVGVWEDPIEGCETE